MIHSEKCDKRQNHVHVSVGEARKTFENVTKNQRQQHKPHACSWEMSEIDCYWKLSFSISEITIERCREIPSALLCIPAIRVTASIRISCISIMCYGRTHELSQYLGGRRIIIGDFWTTRSLGSQVVYELILHYIISKLLPGSVENRNFPDYCFVAFIPFYFQ